MQRHYVSPDFQRRNTQIVQTNHPRQRREEKNSEVVLRSSELRKTTSELNFAPMEKATGATFRFNCGAFPNPVGAAGQVWA